ncbi:type II toxin-antitoxin system PemK/MazF family toxin [Lactobacillus sp. ESL0684]|uniref:type II toxin-antitoxin system PemK/MazF family toxin n=1 Tax=Lactobacillus sp. ESL0684 TaxID=2983213 RepID=UPI0023F6DAE8|nr:type II toxin-antitoxin system PemK/MazF family toxin [Lactobacillus sp. ESL0684]WEV43482.1 type II toxin-antitoxin system PemK/MazF family toxin [Lactobacillus sp. ESL0684]
MTTNFNVNDIVDAYVTYFEGEGGKRRPALVVGRDNDTVDVLKITSKYEGKSKSVKAHRYPLKDWQIEGLSKPSYVDIMAIQKLYISEQRYMIKRGTITDDDLEGLAKFITKYA